MRTVLFLIATAVLVGCSARPATPSAPNASDGIPTYRAVVNPIVTGTLLPPDSLVATVAATLDGQDVVSATHESYVTYDSGVFESKIVVRSRAFPGYIWIVDSTRPAVGSDQHAPTAVYRGYPFMATGSAGQPDRRLEVKPGRFIQLGRGLVHNADIERAFSVVDLDRLASMKGSSVFAHPVDQFMHFGLDAYDARVADRARRDAFVLPHVLASVLPDTAGLGIPPSANVYVRSEWEEIPNRPDTRDVASQASQASLAVVEAGDTDNTPMARLVLYDTGWGDLLDSLRVPAVLRKPYRDGVVRVPPEQVGTAEAARDLGLTYQDSSYHVRVGPRRRIEGYGPDQALARRLLARVDREALAGLQQDSVWTAADGRTLLFSGVRADGPDVEIHTGQVQPWKADADRSTAAYDPTPVAYTPPKGWATTGVREIRCYVTYADASLLAVLHRTPFQPCRESRDRPTLADSALTGTHIGIRFDKEVAISPIEWLVSLDGFAASKLPPWSAAFETTDGPRREVYGDRDGVRLSLRGQVGTRDLAVEAALVPAVDWLFVVYSVGPPSERRDARRAVDQVAHTLRGVDR